MSDNPYLSILDADAQRREQTTGQPADGGNPYLRMLEDGEAGHRARLRAAATQAVDTNPDEIARKRRVAALLGLPPTGADAIDDELKREARIRTLDAATADAPVTRRSMGDPAFAKVAHDEAEALAALEKRMGGPLARVEPIRGPEATTGSVLTGIAKSVGQAFEGTRQGLRQAFGDLFGFEGTATDAGRRAATNELERTLSTPEFETSTARGVYSAGTSIVQQVPGIVAGVMTGGASLPLSFLGLMTTSQAYSKYRARGASGGEAALGAIGEGATEVATELLPMSFLVKSFGRVGAGRFLTGLLAREVPSEQIATLVQDAIDTAVANPDKTWAQYAAERPDAAYQTLVATIVQGGVMGGASAIAGRMQRDQRAAETADAYVQRMTEVMQMAAESKLRERAPESFKAFVDAAATEQGGALADVWVSGKALADVLNQGGITEAEIASILPSAVGQLAEAVELGADVKIPVGEFATAIAGTAFEAPLMEHIKADPDAPSAAEAREMGAQAEATLRAEVERAVGVQAQTEQWRTEAQAVYDNVLGQIAATKRFADDTNAIYATLVRDFYAVTAARTGLTPQAMFDAYPLRVQATAPRGMEGMLAQGATETPEFRAWFGDSKVVDAQGKPLVVYHGTNRNFDVFDTGRVGADGVRDSDGGVRGGGGSNTRRALYFASEAEGGQVEAYSSREGGNIVPAFVSLQNPATVDQFLEAGAARDEGAAIAALEAAGYDGVVYENARDGKVVIAFRPEQIKSAIGNRGTFDPNDPSILNQPAYHGSPHTFDAFSLDAIGTGEGAQAFGWGLYFAENPSIAQSYRIPAGRTKYTIDGRNAIDAAFADRSLNVPVKYLQDWQGDVQAAMRSAIEDGRQNVADAIKALVDSGRLQAADPGQFYEVDIPDDAVEKMIRWDAPLSKQPQVVQDAVEEAIRRGIYDRDSIAAIREYDTIGKNLYNLLGDTFADQREASEFFASQGVPGLVFLDANSRDKGDGTRNIVLWDQPTIDRMNETVRRAQEGERFNQSAIPQTDTPEFRAWFGESKVVDAQGKPLRVFHGTAGNFDAFDPAKTGQAMDAGKLGRGFYFSSSPAWASNYGKAAGEKAGGGANVMPVYLSLQNPIVLSGPGDVWTKLRAKSVELGVNLDPVLDEAATPNPEWSKAFTEAAQRAGHDGVILDGAGEFVVFDPTQIKSAIGNRGTFDANDPSILNQTRPQSGPRATFDPRQLTITLYQGADLSSFLHEMGHFQLEVLADLASQPGAPQQIVQDMDALLRWFGVADLETWRRMTLDEQRPYHEKFAEGFEVYLLEGRAPNVELVGAFQRIRAWMLRVYKSIKDGFGFTLTDEVRGVFDRLLAVDEAILTAQQMRSFEALFASPDDAKMTAEEWARYQELANESHAEAMDALGKRSVANMKWLDGARSRALRALQQQEAEKRREVRMEVAREIMSQPVYRAMQFLRGPVDRARKAEASDPNTVDITRDSMMVAIAKLGGLDRAQIRSRWGVEEADVKQNQPVFGKPVARVTGGQPIDLMGERLLDLGYLTPDEAGRFDEKQFEEAFFAELSGQPQYSIGADYGAMSGFRTDEEEAAAIRGERDEQLARMTEWQGGRLDLEAMKLRFGDAPDAPWRKLGTGARGMVRSDGLDPELVAEFFGFTSADHLVTELLQATPPRERIQAETDQRMMERYGDLVDPKQVALAVDQAVHNEARGRFVAMELAALQRATSVRQGKVDVLAAQAKAYAQQALAALRIRDIRPAKYTAAEGKAARASMAALKAGDSALAATEKRNQLLHHYTARAAADTIEEVEKGVAYLRKFDREGTRKGLDVEYVEQIDALLERFDLRAISNKAADRRAGLQAWIESQRAQGLEPSIPDALLDEAYRQPYRNLTVEEFRGLVDSVKQIEHLGRLKKRLLTARDQREYEAIRDEIAGSIVANAGNREADTRTPVTWTGRMRQMGRRFVAAHLKVATLARVMDGGKDGGPVWEHFVRGANERGDMETTMRAAATERLTEILAPVFKLGRMGGAGTYFATIKRSLNREQRLAIALNTGNAGNLQRLLDGEGWTIGQVQPVLASLTKAEWIAVQEVWDHMESYRPLIAEKERRVYGKEPAWVEAVPRAQATADGGEIPLRGGYYPIRFDSAASIRAEEHSDAEDAKRQLQGAYTSATTRRSFTKQRAEAVKGRPLLYSLSGVYSGVNDVIHDLAWHEWLIDTNRLLRSQTIDAAIREHYGPEAKAQLKSWVQDIAEGDKGAQNVGEAMLSRLRQGVSAAGLGFNVMSAAIQLTGFNQSIVRIGAGWVGRGIAKTIANPVAAAREVNEASEFMRNRARTRFRELNELRNRVEDQSGVMRAVQANSYWLMMRVQKMVDIPTWIGAHEKALAQGADERAAVALADQAVIDAQGGGQIKDLSQIERGGPALKLFTVYYSFMNTTFNLAAQKVMTADTPAKRAKLAVDFLMLFTVPAVLGAVLKDALTPGGDDDEDLEALARKLAAEQLSYMMGTMVLVRELGFLAKDVTGAEGARFGYEGPAGLRALSDLAKLGKQAAQGEFDDAFRKAAINVLGDLTGLPAAQINRSITGAQALAEGETDNPAALVLGYQQ